MHSKPVNATGLGGVAGSHRIIHVSYHFFLHLEGRQANLTDED